MSWTTSRGSFTGLPLMYLTISLLTRRADTVTSAIFIVPVRSPVLPPWPPPPRRAGMVR